jgi:hypothetical protein
MLFVCDLRPSIGIIWDSFKPKDHSFDSSGEEVR